MKTIYFIEGTPGVGKTSYIDHLMLQSNEPCRRIYSGDVVPENMVRKAVKEGNTLTIDEARRIYRERSYADYRTEHLRIWREFCMKNRDSLETMVVDAGLIQAPLYELMGLYTLSPEKICFHIQEIVNIVKQQFTPVLVYIHTSCPDKCIRQAIKNQPQQRAQWVKGFCTWLEVAPYPMEKGYTGPEGIERFVTDRALVDAYLVDNLVMEKNIHNRDRNDLH